MAILDNRAGHKNAQRHGAVAEQRNTRTTTRRVSSRSGAISNVVPGESATATCIPLSRKATFGRRGAHVSEPLSTTGPGVGELAGIVKPRGKGITCLCQSVLQPAKTMSDQHDVTAKLSALSAGRSETWDGPSTRSLYEEWGRAAEAERYVSQLLEHDD